jgi:hypothetical protein
MAQKVEVTLVDDLDGSAASRTVRFAFEGREYEIDLNDKHADKLTKVLAPYVESARRVGGRKVRGGQRPASGREQNQAIRQWARGQGIEISDRGRIPVDVQLRYEQAHGKK